MPKYGISALAMSTPTTPLKTLLRLAPASNKKIELVYAMIMLAGSAAPSATDLNHEVTASLLSATAAGTLTSVTPAPFDSIDDAAAGTYGVNATVEPTAYGSGTSPLSGSFNQRNGFVWGVPRGEGLITRDIHATTKNLGVRIRSSAAGSVDANFHIYV